MNNKNKYASRRATPWDKMERTPMQEFIKANYDELWTQKHTVPANTNEAVLINTDPSSKMSPLPGRGLC